MKRTLLALIVLSWMCTFTVAQEAPPEKDPPVAEGVLFGSAPIEAGDLRTYWRVSDMDKHTKAGLRQGKEDTLIQVWVRCKPTKVERGVMKDAVLEFVSFSFSNPTAQNVPFLSGKSYRVVLGEQGATFYTSAGTKVPENEFPYVQYVANGVWKPDLGEGVFAGKTFVPGTTAFEFSLADDAQDKEAVDTVLQLLAAGFSPELGNLQPVAVSMRFDRVEDGMAYFFVSGNVQLPEAAFTNKPTAFAGMIQVRVADGQVIYQRFNLTDTVSGNDPTIGDYTTTLTQEYEERTLTIKDPVEVTFSERKPERGTAAEITSTITVEEEGAEPLKMEMAYRFDRNSVISGDISSGPATFSKFEVTRGDVTSTSCQNQTIKFGKKSPKYRWEGGELHKLSDDDKAALAHARSSTVDYETYAVSIEKRTLAVGEWLRMRTAEWALRRFVSVSEASALAYRVRGLTLVEVKVTEGGNHAVFDVKLDAAVDRTKEPTHQIRGAVEIDMKSGEIVGRELVFSKFDSSDRSLLKTVSISERLTYTFPWKTADPKIFVKAAKDGNVTWLTAQLTDGIDVNTADGNGVSALYWASSRGRSDAVALLLDKGADPSIGSVRNNAPPLVIAVSNGHMKIVELLLAAGADPNAAGTPNPPLCAAAEKGHHPIAKMLLDAGADPSLKNAKSKTALDLCTGRFVLVANLLREKLGLEPEVKITPEQNAQMLKLAAAGNWEEMVALHEKGARFDGYDVKGLTALMLALDNGHIDVAIKLLEAGVPTGKRDKEERSDLDRACAADNLELIKAFEAHGARFGQQDVIFAAEHCSFDVFSHLENRIGVLGLGRVAEQKILIAASKSGNVDTVNFVLDAGVKPLISPNFANALHVAAGGDSLEVLKLLVDTGAPIKMKAIGSKNYTALHAAAAGAGNVEIVTYLIDAGVELNAKDFDFRLYNVLHLAVESGRAALIPVLVEAGLDPNETAKNGDRPLHIAVSKGQAACITALMKAGADPEQTNSAGNSAIKYATMQGKDNLVPLMVNK